MRERRYGYYAVDRGIFHNPLFRNAEWFRAWLWLISFSAWQIETGARLGRATVALKRGQLACTVRELAGEWKWSKTGVEHFLGRLTAEKMIECAAIRTQTQTNNGPKQSVKASLITICNYDKYQKAVKPQYSGVGRGVGRGVGQEQGLLPCISEEIGLEPVKPVNNKESGAVRMEGKPAHQKISRDGRWIWLDYGTAEWIQYARDYEDVANCPKEIKLMQGGSGNWFHKMGQATAPHQKRRRPA